MNIWNRLVAQGLTPLATPEAPLTIAGTPVEVTPEAKAAADAAAKKTADEAAAAAAKKTEPTPEEKAAADKAAADKKAADDAAAASGKGKEGEKPKAPDAYALTVPDDVKDLIGDEDLEFIRQAGKTNDWTQEEAQAEVDGILTRTLARIDKQREAWAAETKADKVYGGDKLTETSELARKAVNHLRPEGHPRRESFLRLLNRGGIGNHLEVVSVLADLGKLLSEDSPVLGGGKPPAPAVLSDADAMFPSTATVKA